MITVCTVIAGATGTYLLVTRLFFGWKGLGPSPRAASRRRAWRSDVDRWLVQAGLSDVRPVEFACVVSTIAVVGGLVAYALFGALVPALVAAAFTASFPLASYRRQRRVRMERASHAWPRLIEEMRVLTSSAGRSVPQALFEAGERAPAELRDAFAAAHRTWLLSTDFNRTIAVLKSRLGDPTADATCETLLVAHEIGGSDLDRRLEALAADRTSDVQARKDAVARQAGARFARRFVLLVPLGMAAAGLSVGTGRHAYRSPIGQVLVTLGLVMVIGCWFWAGSIMRLPAEERVFDR